MRLNLKKLEVIALVSGNMVIRDDYTLPFVSNERIKIHLRKNEARKEMKKN
jgi:hypothetical protein